MQFESISDVIHMNGHGLYVWISYAVALAVITYNIAAPLLEKSDIRKKLSRQARREQANEGDPS